MARRAASRFDLTSLPAGPQAIRPATAATTEVRPTAEVGGSGARLFDDPAVPPGRIPRGVEFG